MLSIEIYYGNFDPSLMWECNHLGKIACSILEAVVYVQKTLLKPLLKVVLPLSLLIVLYFIIDPDDRVLDSRDNCPDHKNPDQKV